jgi:hypothetical protein
MTNWLFAKLQSSHLRHDGFFETVEPLSPTSVAVLHQSGLASRTRLVSTKGRPQLATSREPKATFTSGSV